MAIIGGKLPPTPGPGQKGYYVAKSTTPVLTEKQQRQARAAADPGYRARVQARAADPDYSARVARAAADPGYRARVQRRAAAAQAAAYAVPPVPTLDFGGGGSSGGGGLGSILSGGASPSTTHLNPLILVGVGLVVFLVVFKGHKHHGGEKWL